MSKATMLMLLMICFSSQVLGAEKESDYFCWVKSQKKIDSKNLKLTVYYLATPEHGGIFVSPNCRGGVWPGESELLSKVSNNNDVTRLRLVVIADFKTVSTYFGLEGEGPNPKLNLYVKKIISNQTISKADWDKIFKKKYLQKQTSQ